METLEKTAAMLLVVGLTACQNYSVDPNFWLFADRRAARRDVQAARLST